MTTTPKQKLPKGWKEAEGQGLKDGEESNCWHVRRKSPITGEDEGVSLIRTEKTFAGNYRFDVYLCRMNIVQTHALQLQCKHPVEAMVMVNALLAYDEQLTKETEAKEAGLSSPYGEF